MYAEKKGSALFITVPLKWKDITIETLFSKIWQAPRKLVHEWRMTKGILLNGKQASWSLPLQKGDILHIPLSFSEMDGDQARYMELDILYEDHQVLVINKPPGLETHPSSPGQNDTLLNGAAYHMLMNGENYTPFHIHRLDKDTSGAILFAKDRLSAAILDRLLLERRIKRTYLALVHGLINRNGTIKESIGRDRHHGTRRRVSPGGRPAVTHYEVIKQLQGKGQTLISCRLDTGRTHQIRVHLSHIGHPLVGDTLYGGRPEIPRQALHASKLVFPHPITEELIEVTAPFSDPEIFPRI
ncbi:RluA family pseudouridine synthase [Peribacillus sp. SCS-37]|uniref:RluA family pseudouridine synthase n=1 Tax=Paraperibacillus esterisolvens TaxID=3115296 RepID=UPI003906667A